MTAYDSSLGKQFKCRVEIGYFFNISYSIVRMNDKKRAQTIEHCVEGFLIEVTILLVRLGGVIPFPLRRGRSPGHTCFHTFGQGALRPLTGIGGRNIIGSIREAAMEFAGTARIKRADDSYLSV
jgi:hypothetical protein